MPKKQKKQVDTGKVRKMMVSGQITSGGSMVSCSILFSYVYVMFHGAAVNCDISE